jgi:hypothetical protein
MPNGRSAIKSAVGEIISKGSNEHLMKGTVPTAEMTMLK